MLPNITGLLCRFRLFTIALHADIPKAVFSIAVREEDRLYLGFVSPDEKNMVMWRLTRLPFGVNCSPFVICAVLRYHLEQANQAASEVFESFVITSAI